MAQRPLSDDEQTFLATLESALAHTPTPLIRSEATAEALAALLLSVARTKSPAELSIGPVCQTPMLAEWLGISRQGVNKGVRERRILGVQVGRTWYYPTWQLGPNQILPAATRLFKYALPRNPSQVCLSMLAYWAWRPSEAESPLGGISPASWIQAGHDFAPLATYAEGTILSPRARGPFTHPPHE